MRHRRVRRVRERLDPAGPLRALTRSLADVPDERDPLNRLLYLEARHFLADHNLNYTDKMGMAAGVEVRTPLLDVDLVEFAARVPPRLKQRGRRGKHILKRAMAPWLPREVVHRPKTGFGAPLRRWMRRELRGMCDDLLSAAAVERRGIFDAGAVRDLVRRDRAGQVDGAYLTFAVNVHRAVVPPVPRRRTADRSGRAAGPTTAMNWSRG